MTGGHIDRLDLDNSSATNGHLDADAVVDLLRRAIVHGDLPPGQRLVTADLAGRFDTTRAAIRRALAKLEGEGLISTERNRGARVREVSLAEAIEITEVRASLEAMCAARMALRSTWEERRRLRSYGEGMLTAVNTGDVWRYNELSHEFHQLIRDVSHQYTATSIIEKLRFQSAVPIQRLPLPGASRRRRPRPRGTGRGDRPPSGRPGRAVDAGTHPEPGRSAEGGVGAHDELERHPQTRSADDRGLHVDALTP